MNAETKISEIIEDIKDCLLVNCDHYELTSNIPAEEIAIFTDNLFFRWQNEVAECAEAVRQAVKAEGKRYFITTCSSTYTPKDMRHIIESGLGRVAGHAFIDSVCKWTGARWKNGAAVVFEVL